MLERWQVDRSGLASGNLKQPSRSGKSLTVSHEMITSWPSHYTLEGLPQRNGNSCSDKNLDLHIPSTRVCGSPKPETTPIAFRMWIVKMWYVCIREEDSAIERSNPVMALQELSRVKKDNLKSPTVWLCFCYNIPEMQTYKDRDFLAVLCTLAMRDVPTGGVCRTVYGNSVSFLPTVIYW